MFGKLIIASLIVSAAFSDEVMELEFKTNEAFFKDGFKAGIKALEFQRRNDGYEPQKIAIKKEFFIVYNITNLPYEEALFLQNIASREGFETHMTKTFLFFGEFERHADALKATQELKEKFDIDAKIEQNKGGDFLITYPKLWGDFYQNLMAQVSSRGYIVTAEHVPVNPKSNIESKRSTKQTQTQNHKIFTLKNSKAMSYKKIGPGNDSRDYQEGGLVDKKDFYSGNYGKPIITNQGEKFYKVLNKNIYFSSEDVVLR